MGIEFKLLPTLDMKNSTNLNPPSYYVISRYETYLIPGETLIPGGRGRGEAFHPGIGYASYLK